MKRVLSPLIGATTMNNPIDEKLIASFTPERIISAYFDYKLAKWDRFSGFDEPEINIPMGADGIKFQTFEKQLKRNAKNISYRVQNDKYIFYPFREVEKLKEPASLGKPAKFRTLSIASIRDVLVQTILYQDVLYEPIESIFRSLDQISVVSYAYRKGKSAPLAAKAIFSYLRAGYWYVFDADLSKYFDSIPHDRLLNRLTKEIGGKKSRAFRLVRRFIHTDLVPYKTYQYAKARGKLMRQKIFHWKKPKRFKRDKGIPQGGVLSGMLANLYLHDFDTWVVTTLGKKIDLKYVRYADDFIILARSAKDLEVIGKRVENQIGKLGLEINKEKTSSYDVRKNGLDFVGFHFDGVSIRVRSKNIDRYKKRIREAIESPPQYVIDANKPKTTLRWLVKRINFKVQGHSGLETCPVCGHYRIGPPRSWITFFKTVTDVKQIHELDKWTRQVIYDYMHKAHKIRISRSALRKARFKSLVNQKYRVENPRLRPCLCDIDRGGLWPYLEDLFQGRQFKTLAFSKEFLVSKVDHNGIRLHINKKEYEIPKDIFLQAWAELRKNGNLSRANLERSGIQCTSQMVSLLSQLPAIQMQLWPIRLHFSDTRPSSFLIRD